ncbi:MAG: sigma-70 family RNA polymerase sigma factor [Planctomycetota bacterium]
MNIPSQTRVSLLLELRDLENSQAWEEFVSQYGPKIYNWCQFWKLQQVDAEDITQALLLKLFQQMRQFEYQPSQGSFRSWLKTVTRNAVRDHWRRKKAVTAEKSEVWEQMLNTPAVEDFSARMEKIFDLELLQFAKLRVKSRVAAHNWKVFELSEKGDMTVQEISAKTGVRVPMVYVAKSKIVRLLKEEVALIEAEYDSRSKL